MEYHHSVQSFGASIPTGVREETTTTRTRDDIVTSLTNIDTKSDAWGKVIPMGFGRHRVGGALVWASQFYKTLETFDDTTTQKSIVSWIDHQETFIDDSVFAEQAIVTNTPFDVTRSSGSQVTHGSVEAAFIDLCYSFGTEGDTRRQRYIEKIRINDVIIFDTTQLFIADGVGFSIRYGYDDAPPGLLAKYPNGKFHYPGQTLVCFDKFPLALFDNSVPKNVDVEWGCCVGAETGPTGPIIIDPGGGDNDSDEPTKLKFSVQGGSRGASSVDAYVAGIQPGGVVVVVTVRRGDPPGSVDPRFQLVRSDSNAGIIFEVYRADFDAGMAADCGGPGLKFYSGTGDYNSENTPRTESTPFIDVWATCFNEQSVDVIDLDPGSAGSIQKAPVLAGTFYSSTLYAYTTALHVSDVSPLKVRMSGATVKTAAGDHLFYPVTGGSRSTGRPNKIYEPGWVGFDAAFVVTVQGRFS